MGPEERIRITIVRDLRNLGFHVSNLSQPRRTMQTPGLPDLYVMSRRQKLAFWIEVKSPKGRLSGPQKDWHAAAAEAGVLVVVATSTADVIKFLTSLPISQHPRTSHGPNE